MCLESVETWDLLPEAAGVLGLGLGLGLELGVGVRVRVRFRVNPGSERLERSRVSDTRSPPCGHFLNTTQEDQRANKRLQKTRHDTYKREKKTRDTNMEK